MTLRGLLVRLPGAVLLVSGVLKLISPWQASEFVRSLTGQSIVLSSREVLLWSSLEVVSGMAGLVSVGRAALLCQCAVLMGVWLAALATIGRTDVTCGCFGPIALPGGRTMEWSLLVVSTCILLGALMRGRRRELAATLGAILLIGHPSAPIEAAPGDCDAAVSVLVERARRAQHSDVIYTEINYHLATGNVFAIMHYDLHQSGQRGRAIVYEIAGLKDRPISDLVGQDTGELTELFQRARAGLGHAWYSVTDGERGLGLRSTGKPRRFLGSLGDDPAPVVLQPNWAGLVGWTAGLWLDVQVKYSSEAHCSWGESGGRVVLVGQGPVVAAADVVPVLELLVTGTRADPGLITRSRMSVVPKGRVPELVSAGSVGMPPLPAGSTVHGAATRLSPLSLGDGAGVVFRVEQDISPIQRLVIVERLASGVQHEETDFDVAQLPVELRQPGNGAAIFDSARRVMLRYGDLEGELPQVEAPGGTEPKSSEGDARQTQDAWTFPPVAVVAGIVLFGVLVILVLRRRRLRTGSGADTQSR